MEVYDEAYALARAIRRSPQYLALQEARRALDADPKGKQMLADLRRREMELAVQAMGGKEPPADQVSTLQKLFEIALLHPGLRDYVTAERSFAALWQDVQKIVGEPAGEVLSTAGMDDDKGEPPSE